jgi:hypothetical protein
MSSPWQILDKHTIAEPFCNVGNGFHITSRHRCANVLRNSFLRQHKYIMSYSESGPSWSYGTRIDNYLCNQCLSPITLWVRISTRTRFTTLCDKVCQWLATGLWFSSGTLVSSTNKTEILLKVALNTIKQMNVPCNFYISKHFIFIFLTASYLFLLY